MNSRAWPKEWEYAARGGLSGKRYPWGDEIIHDHANYSGIGGKDQWGGLGQPNSGTSPVGSFEPNGYGLYDMAGNTRNWCSDWYDENYYYSNSPTSNPKGPDTGYSRVSRGGGFNSTPGGLRVALRRNSNPDEWYGDQSFRCVSGIPAVEK